MVDSLMDFERFSEALESLKGKFHMYRLDDEWVDRLLKLLHDSGT
jgi:hypothetical protein